MVRTATETPLVSAIITTYNRRDFLRQAIKSVCEQTYNNIELIVVDGHSEQTPGDIVDQVPRDRFENISFIRHGEDRGVSASRNSGIRNAQGDLIAFLDDDDTWKPQKIEQQVQTFQRADDEVGVVYTGSRSIDLNGSTITVTTPQHEGDITKSLLCDFTITLPTLMVKKSIINSAGLLDEDMKLYEDIEWTIRLSQHCTFEALSEPLLVTLRDDDEDTHPQLTDNIEMKINESFPQYMDKCRPIAAEYGYLFERKMVGYSYFRLGYDSLVHEEFTQAQKSLSKSVVFWPFEKKFHLFFLISKSGATWYKRVRDVKRKLRK